MSREIKFRAYVKDIDQLDENEIPHKDNFIYGNLARGGHGYDFITSDMHMFNDGYTNFKWQWMIKKGSAEQFTGLKDKNGKDIYEGDILAWHSNIYRKHDWVGLVLYRGAGFAVQESDRSYSSPEWLDCACRKDANIIEVIGNVHDNPELLEE